MVANSGTNWALGAVESVVKRALASVNSRVDAKTEAASKVVEDQAIREQGNLLLTMAPDYLETIRTEGFSEKFTEWLPTTPPAIQAMFENNREFVRDASEASTVFTLFKSQTGFKGQTASEPAEKSVKSQPAQTMKRKQQLDGSVGVRTKGPAPDANADPDNAQEVPQTGADRHAPVVFVIVFLGIGLDCHVRQAHDRDQKMQHMQHAEQHDERPDSQ